MVNPHVSSEDVSIYNKSSIYIKPSHLSICGVGVPPPAHMV